MTTADRARLVWITGAGKGIGRELARHYAQQGWTVAVSARTEADLQLLAEELPAGQIKIFPLDVTDKEAVATTVYQIEHKVGEIDLAILNAGTYTPTPAESFAVDPFRKLVETNLMGTVNGLAPLLEIFQKRLSGQIAVVASLAGYRGLPGAAAYGATKAGLINICESLRPELERHGVRLSVVNPGFIETPLTAKNDFPMPFLMPAKSAARRIAEGLEAGNFEITFPTRFALLMKLLRILPDRLFFLLSRRMVRR